jgi:5-methylcytosine-specific restriction endonuclease McrA
VKLPPNVTSHEWRTVRARVLRSATICALCGRALLPDAPPRSRWSTHVDHRLPLAAFRRLDAETQRRLTLDPANLQATHAHCNTSKRDRPQRRTHPRPQSQEW